jgi:hypothetical protein
MQQLIGDARRLRLVTLCYIKTFLKIGVGQAKKAIFQKMTFNFIDFMDFITFNSV